VERDPGPIESILRAMVICTPPALLVAALLTAGASTPSTKSRVVYEAPKKPEHAAVAEKMRRERILEDSAECSPC